MKEKMNFKILLVCGLIVFLVALSGSYFTSKSTSSDWYESIKPSITPPSYVFPIVWNILFVLIVFSMYYSWTSVKRKKDKEKIIFFFGINFIFNILWSAIYFGMRNPFLAFFELIFLWFSIFLLVFVLYNINKKASYLLIPYWVWVSFAGVLNYLSI